MKWPAVIRPRAEADLQEAKNWYDLRREGLGVEFVLAVRRAIRVLRDNPQRHPLYYRDFRRTLLRASRTRYSTASKETASSSSASCTTNKIIGCG